MLTVGVLLLTVELSLLTVCLGACLVRCLDTLSHSKETSFNCKQEIQRCPSMVRVRFQAVKASIFSGFSLGNPTQKAISSKLFKGESLCPSTVWMGYEYVEEVFRVLFCCLLC